MMHWIPRRWTLVGILLTAMLALSPVAIAQVATTEIADTVYRADGSTATGTVVISWPEFTTASGQSVPAGSTSVSIAAGGILDIQLAPNAGSNPMGSYYTVVYHLDDGSVSHQYWVVPASGTPVKVSAISSTVMPLSVAQQTVSKSYVDTAIAEAVSGVSPADSSTPYVLKTGDTMTGALVLPGDPVTSTQAADKHYIDTSVQQVAAGIGQKVSLLPQATQVVTQPTGTQLEINNLNGVEYASQYLTGQVNNAVANAVSSPDCAAGCDVKVDRNYTSTHETYSPSTWNDQTHVEDARLGAERDSFINPGNLFDSGTVSGQTINLVSTKPSGLDGQTIITEEPIAMALDVSHEAMAGGSNLFPAAIEATVPYFKSTYLVQRQTGTYHTMGQHSVSLQAIDCFGVGDCLIGAQVIRASGGFRDAADEGAHPFDLQFSEDPRVFTGTCSTGCNPGATSITVAVTSNAGTQGEGRYLINKNPGKILSNGLLTGGGSSPIYPTAIFRGTSFPISVFFATAEIAPSQANNIAPGTVTLAIATSGVTAGFATNTAAAPSPTGVACVVDQNPSGASDPHNYEMANYAVVDGTHLQLTLNKVHGVMSTVAIGGLCGYGLEQTVDTKSGIRQVFPVVGAYSSTELYYAGGQTPIVGQMGQTSGFMNISSNVVTITRTNNVVTLTAAGNFPADINGLAMTVAGVADSSYNGTFTVTTTSANTLTYPQTGPNSTSSNGTLSLLTGEYALYPMAEVLGVMNAATKLVDGQMTLAPNTVAWATGDVIEQPHYYQENVGIDAALIAQTTPRPIVLGGGGIIYNGTNSTGLIGWQITNNTPVTTYLGAGGTYGVPFAAFSARGVWQSTMSLDAGQGAVFTIGCNYHGCGRWNSGYDLFQLNSNSGVDTIHYDPLTSTLNMRMQGATYVFTPQSFSVGTINATTINASVINGSVSGNSITSGAVDAAYLPKLGASGSTHAAGIVPDPGTVGGTARFLREDGTWSIPGGVAASPTALLSGAVADYNFLQGSGTVLADISGNGNNGTLGSGALAPTWTASGLTFSGQQQVALPAALNTANTACFSAYINPISSGVQPTNQFALFVSASNGFSGLNLLYEGLGAGAAYQGNTYALNIFAGGAQTTSSQNTFSGYHVYCYVLGVSGRSTDRFFIDGIETTYSTIVGASAGKQTTGNLFLGSSNVSPFTQSGFLGTMYRAAFFAGQETPAQIQQISIQLRGDATTRGILPVTPQPVGAPTLHAIGDSITLGAGVPTPTMQNWAANLSLTNQPAYQIVNWGISGESAIAIAGSEPNRVGLQCATSFGPAIAIFFAGTNDFLNNGNLNQQPNTGQSVMTSIGKEIQELKSAGCRVFVGTMLSRGGSDTGGNSFDSDKNALDAAILTQARASGADGVVDFAANPNIGADGSNANLTYFQGDQIHPTAAGQLLLATSASNTLNYYFGANQNNPTVKTASYVMTSGDGYVSSTCTSACTFTLPDCTGPSGAVYTVANLQSAFTVNVVAGSSSQLINGLAVGSPVTVPANSSVTFRDVPNPKTVSGCHWEK